MIDEKTNEGWNRGAIGHNAESHAVASMPFPVAVRASLIAGACQPGTATVGRRLHVLVVDDIPLNQLLAVRMLQKAGHTAAVAENGQQALDALARDTFDLVLMDVQMPVMDGFEATVRIRRQEKETGRHIPIVAVTAHAMAGDRKRCLNAGMDAYVAKPIQSGELFSTIAEAIAECNKRSEDAARGSRRLSKIDEAIASRDGAEPRIGAPFVEGPVGVFGDEDAFYAAFNLEQVGENVDWEHAEEAWNALNGEMTRLSATLAGLTACGQSRSV